MEIIGNNEKSLTMVLADGLGSGVKANILSTLTRDVYKRQVYDGPAGEVDGAVLDAIYQDRKEATA